MKATNILFTLSLVLAISLASHAQVVGIGTSSPNASAALDITSSTTGLLPPRMTAAQRNAIASPAQGLMVYCTNCGTNGEAQMYNGTAWVNVVGGAATFGCGDNVTHLGLTYGTVIGANSKCWLDRNLGATAVAISSTDANSYGDYYQWGRGTDGHQISNSINSSTNAQSSIPSPGINFIIGFSNWYNGTNPNPIDLWKPDGTGVNNPCPSGYRIPIDTEWNAERLSWSTNNAAGAIASPLKLPKNGRRTFNNGGFERVTTYGYYWSSTFSGADSRGLNFEGNNAVVSEDGRAQGRAVRCLKD